MCFEAYITQLSGLKNEYCEALAENDNSHVLATTTVLSNHAETLKTAAFVVVFFTSLACSPLGTIAFTAIGFAAQRYKLLPNLIGDQATVRLSRDQAPDVLAVVGLAILIAGRNLLPMGIGLFAGMKLEQFATKENWESVKTQISQSLDALSETVKSMKLPKVSTSPGEEQFS